MSKNELSHFKKMKSLLDSIITDLCLSNRKAAENNQNIVHQFLNNMIDIMIYQDSEMNIIWANQAAISYLNKTLNEITGAKCYKAWHNFSTPCENCPAKEAIKTGQSQSSEVVDSQSRHFIVVASPVKDETGKIIGIISGPI